jgi:hypothetical protein
MKKLVLLAAAIAVFSALAALQFLVLAASFSLLLEAFWPQVDESFYRGIMAVLAFAVLLYALKKIKS